MNPNPEQVLQQFRLAPSSPELRARALAAAREEWNRPDPASAWWTLRRPLLAIAASLVLVAAGSWTNGKLVSPMTVSAARPAGSTQSQELEFAGRPNPQFGQIGTRFVDPKAATAALQMRQDQIRELLDPARLPTAAPAPNGQTRQFRQNPHGSSSC